MSADVPACAGCASPLCPDCRPRRIAIGTLLVLAAAITTACSSTPPVRACATLDVPPIVLDDVQCTGPDRRWYEAPASDIETDDVPVVGQPLDGDFWDVRDQLDLDERRKSASKTPSTFPPGRTTTKAKPTVASSRPPATRR